MRAVCFSRASQDRHGVGLSVASQDEANLAECERRGWEVVAMLSENNISASRHSKRKGARTEWGTALNMIRDGEADVLVSCEGSRNTRELGVYLNAREVFAEAGALLCYHGRIFDLTRTDDRFSTGLDALVAERETDQLRDRVLRGVRSRAASGRPHGRNTYGYRRFYDPETKAYLGTDIDPEQAAIVREIFERYVAGAGHTKIATELNRRGVPPPSGKPGKAWASSTVGGILRRETYLGHRTLRGEITKRDAHPAIISPEQWDSAQLRLNSYIAPPGRDSAVRHLLSGLMTCGVCGGYVSYSRGTSRDRNVPIYGCTKRHCVGRAAHKVEPFVVERVIALVAQEQSIRVTPKANPRVAEALTHLEGLQARLAGFTTEAAAGNLTPARLGEIERQLTPQIEAAEKRLAQLRAQRGMPVLPGPIEEVWDDLLFDTKRQIIRTSVSITIVRVGQGRRAPIEEGVIITPRWATGVDEPQAATVGEAAANRHQMSGKSHPERVDVREPAIDGNPTPQLT